MISCFRARLLWAAAPASLAILLAAGCAKKGERPDDSETVESGSNSEMSSEETALEKDEERDIPNASGEEAAREISAISLFRSPCFGSCPVYKVEITADGSVHFEGEEYVDQKGSHQEKVDPDIFQELAASLEESAFFELGDEDLDSKRVVTDLSTIKISATRGGEEITIAHYLGNLDAPAAETLTRLADQIDELTGVKQWVGEDK